MRCFIQTPKVLLSLLGKITECKHYLKPQSKLKLISFYSNGFPNYFKITRINFQIAIRYRSLISVRYAQNHSNINLFFEF